jgi:hypothetical protein
VPRLIPSLRRSEPEAEAQPEATAAPLPATPEPAPLPAVQQRRRMPNVGALRRERRVLQRVREERIRDLGGLMLEMFKRDRFREDIVLEHCAQLVGLENRLHEVNVLLSYASGRRRVAPGPQCACGAPLLLGARFCASCGRPTATAAAGDETSCHTCGQPIAAGARFCPACGTAVAREADAAPAPTEARD